MSIVLRLGRRLQRGYSMLGKLLYVHGVLSTKSMTLPDFLGIGAQKSGTTWLYENLRQHPDLYLTREKEIEYFDHHFHRSLNFYSEKFRAGTGKLKGEISPSYGYLHKSRIKFIRAILPDVKLIFLMRNPVERIWSHAFMSLVKHTGRALDEVPDAEFYAYFKRSWVVRASNYPAMLDNWLSVFPREQMYLGLYDEIKNSPQKLLCEIFAHLGVTTSVDWNDFPYKDVIIPPAGPDYAHHDQGRGVRVFGHKTTDSFMPQRHRNLLMGMYRNDIEILNQRFGLPTLSWLTESDQDPARLVSRG